MTPFLYQVADDLFHRFNGDLREVTIVFPSKRAGLFFNQHLAQIADRPLWSPDYTTLTELYHQLSPLTVADPVLLIYHLYAAYAKVYEELGIRNEESGIEPLDQFYSWGEVMINDFDDIDNNLAHADAIFRNLKDLDDLTDFKYLTQEQIKAIEHYFGAFDPDRKTRLKEKFLTIWNLLYPVYLKFRERLSADGIAYEGMLRRGVVENAIDWQALPSKHYVFVGFNVLPKTDQRFFDLMRKEGKALFYWDYDKAYLGEDGKDAYFEAGRFVKENLLRYGCVIDADSPCYDQMRQPKSVTFIGASSNRGQANYVGQWIKDHVDPEGNQNRHAVVLANPNMLQAVLHSLPESGDADHPYRINVTMGYPMGETPICSFLLLLADMQVHGARGRGYWKYGAVAGVLRHPYTVRLAGEAALAKYAEIRKRNMLFVPEQFFADCEPLARIFAPQDTPVALLDYLSLAVQDVGKSYASTDPNTEKSPDTQLYEEAIYNAFTLINRLRTVEEAVRLRDCFRIIREGSLGRDRMVRLLSQLMAGLSVPFHGEPAEGIQIISLLDTRNLDFDDVIIIGANDEVLPGSVHQPSFIPYTLREAHGLTTMEARSSVQAYTFYRLIQRACDLTLMYNNDMADSGVTKGDMSRFMTQLLVEQDTMFGKDTTISQKALQAKVGQATIPTYQVEKDHAVMQRLFSKFAIYDQEGRPTDTPEKRKFCSPTAINAYINCPLQFYFKYVAGLKTEEDVNEEVGNDVFGNIFHFCMESLYRPLIGKTLQRNDLIRMSRDKQEIRRLVDEGFRTLFFHVDDEKTVRYNGEQTLNAEVIMKYVEKQLSYDAQLCPLRIEGVENKEHVMELEVGTMRVRLGGVIDRLDTIFVGTPKEQHRIVDYKTSASAQNFATLDNLFDPDNSNRPYHILQTFYYSDIYTDTCNRKVAPALMYIKPARIDDEENAAREAVVRAGTGKNKVPVTDFADEWKSAFHERLVSLLNEIFSSDAPFCQTENLKQCDHCDFKSFCGRG